MNDLPSDVLEGAALRGNEYGWYPKSFSLALRRAETSHKRSKSRCGIEWHDVIIAHREVRQRRNQLPKPGATEGRTVCSPTVFWYRDCIQGQPTRRFPSRPARRGTDLLNFQIRRTWTFLLRDGLAFADVFPFDCFFFIDFLGADPRFSRDFFRGRIEGLVFDLVRLLLFGLEGMAAVYHRA